MSDLDLALSLCALSLSDRSNKYEEDRTPTAAYCRGKVKKTIQGNNDCRTQAQLEQDVDHFLRHAVDGGQTAIDTASERMEEIERDQGIIGYDTGCNEGIYQAIDILRQEWASAPLPPEIRRRLFENEKKGCYRWLMKVQKSVEGGAKLEVEVKLTALMRLAKLERLGMERELETLAILIEKVHKTTAHFDLMQKNMEQLVV